MNGYFTPIRTGFEKEVRINHLGPDELMILSCRIQEQLHTKITEILRKYNRGYPVRFYWNRELRSGIIRRVSKRSLKVEAGDGNYYMVKPGDIMDEPAFSAPEDRAR